MWTEAHRARHEAGLKEMVSTCAVEEMARWLERADPPRSEKATLVLPVIGAIAWYLRVGGPWRALPGGFPAWRTVYGWFRRWLELGSRQWAHATWPACGAVLRAGSPNLA